MKVFISWSGEYSNKIAEALRKWIKHVIQTVEPFVSSEDIQKGSRWSTDIAKELQNTDFGILCVTRDNFTAPWLMFEAGALSKTMDKALVVPLLFNLNPSDLSDSPLLQFQASPFSKDEMRKLIFTMNEKIESKIDDIDEAFEKWYPDLEEALILIASSVTERNENSEDEITKKSSQVLEEILSLSRENQKLLRNPEYTHSDDFKLLNKRLEHLYNISEENEDYRRRCRIYPTIIEELYHYGRKEIGAEYGFLLALSLYKEDCPWLYDMGRELLYILKQRRSREYKIEKIRNFMKLIDFSQRFIRGRDEAILLREMPMLCESLFDELIYSKVDLDSPR